VQIVGTVVEDDVASVPAFVAVILIMQRLVHVANELDDQPHSLRLCLTVCPRVSQDGEKLVGVGQLTRLTASARRCSLIAMSRSAQRRSKRKSVQIIVTLVIEGDAAEHLANAVDLSQHGLRLQTDVPLVPGQRVGLLLSDNPSYVLGARVAWLGKADSEQAGEAGVEFLKPLAAPV
jgi:hypothetical protein